jgi:perosamine synthetase
MLCEITGAGYAVAVVNGTAALHVALAISGVEADDEVLLPALTFVATANAVAYLGAVPHLIDSCEETLGIDPAKLEKHLAEITKINESGCINRQTGRRISALVPMHTFGHPVDLDRLRDLCAAYRLVMVEDSAEAIGTLYKGRHVGNWGNCAILSFNGNKTVTTGGGGAILTNDGELADVARHLTTTAKKPHPWRYFHDRVGYNCRLPNLNAALGCAQLEQLGTIIERKREIAARYAEAFAGIGGLRFFVEPEFARSNYWLNAILLDPQCVAQRDSLLESTNRHGIMTRPAWTLMHRLPMFSEAPRMDLGTSESIQARLINLPSSPF